MESHNKLEMHWEMRKLKSSLNIGDLVRMCTQTERDFQEPHDIDWLYGLYMGTTIDREGSQHGWSPIPLHKVLYNGRPMKIDHFWFLERIADELRD